MKQTMIQCLQEDHKHAFDRVFDLFDAAGRGVGKLELPALRIKYMVDDYQKPSGRDLPGYRNIAEMFRAGSN